MQMLLHYMTQFVKHNIQINESTRLRIRGMIVRYRTANENLEMTKAEGYFIK